MGDTRGAREDSGLPQEESSEAAIGDGSKVDAAQSLPVTLRRPSPICMLPRSHLCQNICEILMIMSTIL